MNFIFSVQDKNNIFLILEYVRGVELFQVIREIGIIELHLFFY